MPWVEAELVWEEVGSELGPEWMSRELMSPSAESSSVLARAGLAN